MDKLIELINEHQKEIHGDYYLEVVAYRDGIFWSDGDCTSSVMDEIHLISKPYGFILWLIDNDYIDYDKIQDDDKFNTDLYKDDNSLTKYEALICDLAIRNDAIEFLTSILK